MSYNVGVDHWKILRHFVIPPGSNITMVEGEEENGVV